MKCISVIPICFLVCFCAIQSVSSQVALTPPRGWNSYDSFSWIISEQEFLDNAKILSERLLKSGYEYAVVDFLWYRNLKGDINSRGSDSIDEWGRLVPDLERWPSSINKKGFSDVADQVHKMGLKFGIHHIGGINTQAYDQDTPILDISTGKAYSEGGRAWFATDIGIPSRPCKWINNGFIAVNVSSGAGQAYLRSVYDLYASWGVDFVKLDCVFGDDLNLDEITAASETYRHYPHSTLLSISPGVGATPDMATKIHSFVSTYRVTGNVWDDWAAVAAQFDVARDFAASKLIGANGLNGSSWPDLDMLAFGWITEPGVKQGPHRYCKLYLQEQKTQITLWSMAKSPLIYGGDLRKLDDWTFNLLTNRILLEINAYSSNNVEFPSNEANIRIWVATGGRNGEATYVAFFNLNEKVTTISRNIADLTSVLPQKRSSCYGIEIFSGAKISGKTLWAEVQRHSCVLFVLKCR